MDLWWLRVLFSENVGGLARECEACPCQWLRFECYLGLKRLWWCLTILKLRFPENGSSTSWQFDEFTDLGGWLVLYRTFHNFYFFLALCLKLSHFLETCIFFILHKISLFLCRLVILSNRRGGLSINWLFLDLSLPDLLVLFVVFLFVLG